MIPGLTLEPGPAVTDTDGDGLADAVETNTGIYVSASDTGTDPAKADTDGDGANDGAELALGTNPLDPDTDHDGIRDGTEVAWGRNPLSADSYNALPFSEGFETNTTTIGDLNGQHGWDAWPANAAIVQNTTIHTGTQALQLNASNAVAAVHHLFQEPAASVVWADLNLLVTPAATPSGALSGSAAFNTVKSMIESDSAAIDEYANLTVFSYLLCFL